MASNLNTSLYAPLQIWQLSKKGASLPLSHKEIMSAFEVLLPDEDAQDVLNGLCTDKLVRCTIHGTYELTPEGCKQRALMPNAYRAEKPEKKEAPIDVHAWDDFRALIQYYIDCVQQQERKQEYLERKHLGKKYCIPILEFGWLRELGEKRATIRVPVTPQNQVPIQMLKARSEFDEDIYIGYPVEAFQFNSKTLYTPIGLIPADIQHAESSQTEVQLLIRHDEAELNQTWVDFHFNPQERKQFQQALDKLHRHDDYVGLTDIKLALPFLARFGQDDEHFVFNPNHLDPTLPIFQRDGEHQVCNCAVLFVGKHLQYSRTLKLELAQIAKEEDAVLDRTALAYIFRQPTLPVEQEHLSIPHSFISSNDNQHLAVEQVLSCPASVITGPPGTGKSQVAVNIIANLILQGKTALFTSRNHKAVHAIWDRSADIISRDVYDVVKFCTTPDGDMPQPWFRQDLPQMVAQAKQHYSPKWKGAYDDVCEADKLSLDAAAPLAKRATWEAELSRAQKRQEELEQDIFRTAKQEAAALPSVRELSSIRRRLCEAPQGSGIFHLIRRFNWHFFGRKMHERAWEDLCRVLPTFGQKILSLRLIKTKLEQLEDLLSERAELISAKREIQKCCESLPPRQERFDFIRDQQEHSEPLIRDALAHALLTPPAEASAAVLTMLRGFMNRGKDQKELFLRHEEQQTHVLQYRRFLDFAPAWATTLLSLTKASPCLPAVFDRVLIDEASQCDIAPIIPALFRAKGVVMIGDPQQFPPVLTLKESRNAYLKRKHGICGRMDAFDYLSQTAYSVMTTTPVMLTNHYRCHPDIAAYFNDVFYGGKLNVIADTHRWDGLRSQGFTPGVEWIDIQDSLLAEMNAVVERVSWLAHSGFRGSLGVITPSRRLANELDTRLNKFRNAFSEPLIVNTVNAFQGGEKDVIIFMLAYTSDQTRGQMWYMSDNNNRYIYNVAVSRARACLVLVGDKQKCKDCDVTPLRKLAQLPWSEKHLHPRLFDSVWEERFHHALTAAGIEATPQYHLVGRRLDLAVITDAIKLDIEVDGVRWHTEEDGSRKVDDIWRDIQVSAAGWQVKRFWVFELEQDMERCVREVEEMLK